MENIFIWFVFYEIIKIQTKYWKDKFRNALWISNYAKQNCFSVKTFHSQRLMQKQIMQFLTNGFHYCKKSVFISTSIKVALGVIHKHLKDFANYLRYYIFPKIKQNILRYKSSITLCRKNSQMKNIAFYKSLSNYFQVTLFFCPSS